MAARGSRSGKGRSADSYAAFDLEPFNDFAEQALETIGTFGASLDVIEARMPKVASLLYNVIGKGLSTTQEQIRQTEEAMKRIDKMLGQQFKELEKRGKAQQKISSDVAMALTNAVFKFGKDTRKMYQQLGQEEAALYEQWNQRRIDDMKKDVLSKGKLIKSMLFDLTTDEVKKAVMAPFQHAIDEFGRFQNTIAGKTVKFFIPGRKAMKDGFAKAKDWFVKGFQGDIWSNVIKIVVKGIWWVADKIKKVLQFDVFDFIKQKWTELKNLIESMPLFEKAKENWLTIQDAMADMRQQFGGTIASSRELTNAIYAASNAVITVEDNTRALNAVLEAGVSGTERRAQMMERVALLTKATGISEQDNVEYLIFANEIMGMTEDSAFAMAASFDSFTDGLRGTEAYVASTEEIMQAILTHQDDLQRMERTGFGTTESLQRDMMALTQWEKASHVALGTATDLYAQFGTVEGIDFLGAMLGDPETVRQRIESGDIAGVMEDFLTNYRDLGISGEALMEEAIQRGLNLDINSIELLSEEVGSLSGYVDAATDSQLEFSEALPRVTGEAEASMTALESLDARLQDVANGFSIGGIRMGEFGEMMEVFDTRLQVFTDGFGMAGEAADFLFGPLSPIAKILTGAPLALAAIGGIVGDFSEEFKDFGNLGEFFGFTKETVDEIWPGIEEGLRSMWSNIHKYFTDASYGSNGDQTMFGLMLSTGVDWVVNHGPQVISQVTDVVVELFDALATAFETMGSEESGLGTALSTLFVEGINAAIPIIEGAIDIFVKLARSFIGILTQVMESPDLAPEIGGFVRDLFTLFDTSMQDAGGILQDAFLMFKDTAMPFINEIGQELGLALLETLAALDPTGGIGLLVNQARTRLENDRAGITGTTPMGVMQNMSASQMMSDVMQAESSGIGSTVSDVGASGFYQLMPGTATSEYETYLAGGGEQFGEFGRGTEFTTDSIQQLSQDQQMVLAQQLMQRLLDTYSDTETPVEFALMAYNGGEGASGGMDNFYERANSLLGSPSVWLAKNGWGNQSVTYVLRNRFLMENPGQGRPTDDTLYQMYLGWPRMPIPADFGAPQMWDKASEVPRTYSFMGFDHADDVARQAAEFTEQTAMDTSQLISVSDLPQQASGGIVSEATALVAGEAGEEAIIPLDDWNRDQERRHRELVQEMRNVSDKLDEVRRATEDYNTVAAAMGAK